MEEKTGVPFNSLICGDSIDVMRTFPDESFDVVITSPPYNLRNSSGNWAKGSATESRWKNAKIRHGYEAYSDNIPYAEYVTWQRDCLAEMFRLIKPTGAIFYNHKNRVQNGLMQDRSSILEGFPVRQVIIWQRSGGINFNDGYFLPTYENIYVIVKPDFKLLPKMNRYGDVWKISQARNNSHPAPFPIAIPERILEATGAKKVLDPFSGSGTTVLAAVGAKSQYVGIDISQEYCDMAQLRVDNRVPTLFDEGKE